MRVELVAAFKTALEIQRLQNPLRMQLLIIEDEKLITASKTALGKKAVLEIQRLQDLLRMQLLMIEDEIEERMKHEDER